MTYTHKLKPKRDKTPNTKHGVYSLAELLKADIDGRYFIARQRNQLEAELVDHCGGADRLTPPMILLIKRITAKSLEAAHAEKMALVGEYNLTGDNRYLALSNSLRLDIMALQGLLNDGKGRTPDLKDYLQSTYGDKNK